MTNPNASFEPRPPSRPPGLWRSWSRGRILLLAVFLMGSNFLGQVLFYSAGGELFIPVLAGAAGGLLLPLVLLCRSYGWSLARDFGIDFPGFAVLAVAALVAAASLAPTSLLAELSLRLHPVDPEWESYFRDNLPDSTLTILLAFVTVVIAAPFAEEIVFRGLLHRLASLQWGALPGAVVSALVFAIIHGEPWFLFGLVGVGLMLAFVYEATGSVTACWVAHGFHNAVSLSAMLSSDSVVSAPAPLTSGDIAWGIVSLGGLIILGKLLLVLGRRRRRGFGSSLL
jgi:membrane protease YdiL (CAAX protease family)